MRSLDSLQEVYSFQEVCALLRRRRQSLRKSRLLEAVAQKHLSAHITIYDKRDVDELALRLLRFDGARALRRIPWSSALDEVFEDRFARDDHDGTCPQCGGRAVVYDGRIWCPACHPSRRGMRLEKAGRRGEGDASHV